MPEQSRAKDVREGEDLAAESRRGEDVTEPGARPDNSVEAAGGAAPSEVSPAYVAELEARARAAEQEARALRSRYEELRDGLQRQTEETRQRLNRAADERALGAQTQFVVGLLPVLDNLQRSIEAALANGPVMSLIDGLGRTVKGFEHALAAVGVEPVRSVGELFDSEVHEAVDTVPVRAEADGVVTREYSRGYKLGDRLLRPARVQVGRAA